MQNSKGNNSNDGKIKTTPKNNMVAVIFSTPLDNLEKCVHKAKGGIAHKGDVENMQQFLFRCPMIAVYLLMTRCMLSFVL